jgi:major vault protein
VDTTGEERIVGDEWLLCNVGAYIPRVEEEIVTIVKAKILTEKIALHLEATQTFVDVYKRKRVAGSQWIVTMKNAPSHMPNVYEKVIGDVPITTLTNRQYCVVLDPIDVDGKPQLGSKEVRKGDASFFLHPGERLLGGIQDVIVLAADETLLLRAIERFDDQGTIRQPGDKWMITGPCDYVPPVQVEVIQKRTALALGENEGVYVRDEKTGAVRAVIGKTYMLQPHEVLWEKELPPIVEELLQRSSGAKHAVKDEATSTSTRDKTRVVRFSVQHNSACQVYNFQTRQARYVYGPDLVMLEPDEQFTVISLSGDKPKTPNVIQSLQLFLGPDFMTDIITVETSDHARLQLQLSYNWHFKHDRTLKEAKDREAESRRLFSVPDFVGDACKAIASRIRGAVATELFDSFHRNSARIIRIAVFGMQEGGQKIKDEWVFPSNGLAITNIDIQSVEPVDQKTRDALQKSVQMAIEITTKSQEAKARHDAERKEQEAKGKLERQVIKDKAEAEKSRKELLSLAAETEAIESTGSAVADAKARAEAALIASQSEVEQARLRAKAKQITAEAELEQLKRKQNAEVEYQRKMVDLELTKARELAEIEASKFTDTVGAIGQDTLLAISNAGPETQVKLLEGLGLKGYLITDGSSPINLFNTAKGMIGGFPGN